MSVFHTFHCIYDQAVNWLLKFIYILPQFLACYSPRLKGAATAFPNLYIYETKLLKNVLKLHVLWLKDMCHVLITNQ